MYLCLELAVSSGRKTRTSFRVRQEPAAFVITRGFIIPLFYTVLWSFEGQWVLSVCRQFKLYLGHPAVFVQVLKQLFTSPAQIIVLYYILKCGYMLHQLWLRVTWNVVTSYMKCGCMLQHVATCYIKCGYMLHKIWLHVTSNVVACYNKCSYIVHQMWLHVTSNVVACYIKCGCMLQQMWLHITSNVATCYIKCGYILHQMWLYVTSNVSTCYIKCVYMLHQMCLHVTSNAIILQLQIMFKQL